MKEVECGWAESEGSEEVVDEVTWMAERQVSDCG